MRIERRRGWLIAVFFSGCCAIAVFLALALLVPSPRTPANVTYDYGVASYCGTLSPLGEKGFRLELAAVTARFHQDTAEAKPARLEGWLRSDQEWANRGLGGFRRWCETEGQAAGQWFAEIGRGERVP